MEIIFILLLLMITIIFFLGIRRALIMSKISVGLIAKYENLQFSSALIDEIFLAIKQDFFLRRILEKNHATKEDIRILHYKLMKYGNFRKYNRYVPITSFFNVSTLDYLLKHKLDEDILITKKMLDHFHF